MKRLIVIFILCLGGISSRSQQNSVGQSGRVDKFGSDNKMLTALDSVVDAVARRFTGSAENCGLSIGVINGSHRYYYNYGETKRNSVQLPDSNTIYEIGSVSAAFCGMLLADAVNRRLVDPDDDIREYLPGSFKNLNYKGAIIRIRHLATHTSGLPSLPGDLKIVPGFDSLNPYKSYDREMILGHLRLIAPSTEPGKVFSYSNLGIAILGVILEKANGKNYGTLVKEMICAPLALNSTALTASANNTEKFADGHNSHGEYTPHWLLNGFEPAGGLKSSPHDMLHFLAYQLEENDGVSRLSHQPLLPEHKSAYCWFIKKTGQGNLLYWHDGATYGFGCFAGFIREKKCAVMVMANSSASVDFIALSILKHLQR